jgi:hypothetical protein
MPVVGLPVIVVLELLQVVALAGEGEVKRWQELLEQALFSFSVLARRRRQWS